MGLHLIPLPHSLFHWLFGFLMAQMHMQICFQESSSLNNLMTLKIFYHESKSKRTRLRFQFWFEAKDRVRYPTLEMDLILLEDEKPEINRRVTNHEGIIFSILKNENVQRHEDRVRGFTPRNQPSASEQKILQRHLEMLTERLTSLTSSTSTHKLSWVSTP